VKKRHMSIDIETLATEGDAAVIAIGATVFDADRFLDQGHLVLINPILSPGARDRGTWMWWCQQDRGIMERMMSGETTPWAACETFANLCVGVDYFWGYPARFDVGHLRALFRNCDREFPFSFRQEMDLSTALKLARAGIPATGEELRKIKESNQAAHDAMADAIVQARQIQVILKHYGM
jgi:hypothetical protein